MKKTLLALLLALCMLVAFTAVTVSAEETETVAETATHTDHCVCGGSAVGVHEHQCADITWTPLSEALTAAGLTETTVNFCKIPSGNYYLTSDIVVTSYASGTSSTGSTLRYIQANITLCLNGFDITTTQLRVFGNVRSGYEMNICDCSGKQDAEGNWTWGGSIIAKDFTGTTSQYGGIFYTHANSVTNIWGGNFIGGAGRKNGATFVVANDGHTAAGGTDQYSEGVQATLSIYNGYIQGSTVTATGGTIHVFHNAILNIYGGTITGGTATTSGGNIYAGKGSITITGGTIASGTATKVGGNIYVGADGALNISGGTITGGNSAGGGNIYADKASINITGGTISNGISSASGGNLMLYSTTDIQNAIITGGTCANYGGNIYTTTQIELTDVTITGGTAGKSGGNLYAKKLTLNSGTISGGTARARKDDDSGVDSSDGGGNLYIPVGSTINIVGGTISGGISKAGGGNIYVTANTSSPTTINFTGGTISGGTVAKGYHGGSIRTGSSLVTINIGTEDGTANPTLKDGAVTGTADGGNIYSMCTVNLYSGTVTGGSTGGEGGNIANYGVLNIYSNATVSGGTSGTFGGNIYNDAGNTLNITGGTITGGTAKAGGNIYFAADSVNTVSNATISGGKAILGAGGEYGIDTDTDTPYAMGGNIYVDEGLTLTLDNCALSGGWAIYRGGSIYNRGTLTINGGSITGGQAKTESTDQKISTGGGNIYTETTMTIDETTISGGQATHGGNISMGGGIQTIQNAKISDGIANLMCDGTTNGNGGNIYSQGSATTTITGCTITGGVGRRGGSVGAWGNVTIEDTTISDGEAIYYGANIMTYGNGQLTLKVGTVITGGKAGSGGGSIHFGSKAGKKQTINEGVTIGMGSAPAGDCISLNGGDLYLVGAPSIAQIYVTTTSANQELIVDELTVTTPIPVEVSAAGAFATSATDKLACFENTQGYVKAYRDGKLYLDAPVAVFVSDNGSDSNPGTQTAPYLTLDHAMHVVADNGTVTIVDKLTQPTWSKHKKSVVLTGGELDLTTGESLTLGDSVQFKTMTVTMPTTAYAIYCNGFKTVINEDVTVRYYDGTDYTTQCAKSSIYGGTNEGTVTGTDLTVLAGTWGFVYGGNESVELTGDVHLTVGGKINNGLDYVTLGHTSGTAGQYLILGGSKGADIKGTIYMNVNEGTTGSSIHGGSNGAVHVDNIELTVSGGEGMAIYGAGRGGAQTVGTVNFYYQGGTYEQIFGGVLSKGLTGDVNLYVTGGNITRRLYGGCYSNYSTTDGWTADNYVTGNVNLIIGEGANISCDLKDPTASGLEAIITGGKYSDRGIYGHGRRGTGSTTDAENATIIFLSKAAYDSNSGNLGTQDSVMSTVMGNAPVADLICYLEWSADDTADVIYANATAVADPQTKVTGDASGISATAALTLSDTSFFYTGNAIEPATVTVSDNWLYGDVVLAYTNNTEIGTGKATITGNGYSVSAEFAITQKPDVAQVIVGDSVTTYAWLQDAVDATPTDGYLKLLGGTNEDITVSSNLYLDLAGFSITGTVTVNEGVTLYGMDSTTDDYDCTDGYGTIKVAGAGTVAKHYKTSVTGKVRRYLTYTEADGSLSFHRIYLGLTSMSLRPSVKGVGYKAIFCADAKAQSMLNTDEAFGYKLWLFDADGNELSATRYLAKEKFVNKGVVTLRLQNFDIENYGTKDIYAEVYLKLTDGTVIDSADYSYTLKQMIERINTDLETNSGAYSEGQMTALQAMLEGTSAVTSWAVENITNWQAPAVQ